MLHNSDSDIYKKLKTNKFIHLKHNQDVTPEIVKNALYESFNNNAFSTFPYITYNMNSYKSIKKVNSGNCIALSLFLKNLLKEKYNISSYLIPATIPIYLQKKGYLDLSHVALAVPSRDKTVYIADPAFYFMEPIVLKPNSDYSDIEGSKIFKMMNIYDDTTSDIKYNLVFNDQKKVYNSYQIIPENTYTVNCINENNSNEYWSYILREIVNPDTSIGKFFIKIRNLPFLVSTLVEDGICKKNFKVILDSPNTLSIHHRDKLIYSGSIKDIPISIVDYVNNKIGKHLDYDFYKTLILTPVPL